MSKRVAILCTVGLVIAIAVMSASPGLKNTFHTHGVLHPWLHLLVFTLVSFCAMFCSDRIGARVLLPLGLMFFGLGTEWAEHMANGVPIEQADVLYDFVGVASGAVAGWLSASWSERNASLNR